VGKSNGAIATPAAKRKEKVTKEAALLAYPKLSILEGTN